MSKKIIGATVGTQLPKPNFKQTDPTKGDYIKNKPDFEGLKSKVDNIDTQLDNKADLVDGKILAEQLPDDIGGITEVSWEDIKNKPFYEIGLNYEWDGNTEGLESFNLAGEFNFYKVSSDIPSKEELTGAITLAYFDCDWLEGTIGAGQIVDFVDTNNGNFAALFNGQLPMIFVVSTAGADSAMGVDFDLPSTGLWFMTANKGEYIHYVKTAEFSVKKIDKKYLPDDIGSASIQFITWEDDD